MFPQFKQLVGNIASVKTYLILANVLLVFFLILFTNLKMLPSRLGDFVFVVFLAVAFALYRPGWSFLLFIGTLPLENINLAPLELGLIIRPYQLFGAVTILAILIRLISGKLYFKLVKLKWFDCLIILLMISSFLSIVNSSDKITSFKLALILSTFAALYFLVRNYIQNIGDLKKIIPFFLSSGIVVVFYGIWQNVAFQSGWSHFEAMPGRPNATFTEPDWLGIYLVLLLTVLLAILSKVFSKKGENLAKEVKIQGSKFKIACLAGRQAIQNSKLVFLFIYLTLVFILLIITVSRSAWLGGFIVTFIYLFIILTNLRFRNWEWRKFFNQFLFIFSAGIISLLYVYVFHLTNFQLTNRIQSTGTGMQEITIACEPHLKEEDNWPAVPIKEPLIIDTSQELEKYRCRHINLEEIDTEVAKGNFVTKAMRKDPNISIRSQIYQKSWEQIQKHPILGIGWGNISNILGKDERGFFHNSSNIFLETWLGAGILGVLSLVVFLLYVFYLAIKKYFYATDALTKAVGLFMIISWFAIIIPNLFNAGIFLGFLWVWVAISQVKN